MNICQDKSIGNSCGVLCCADFKLQLAPPVAHVDVPQEVSTALLKRQNSQELLEWAGKAAIMVNSLSCGIRFCIGKLRLSSESSQELAYAIADIMCNTLKRMGAPSTMAIEIDRVQKTCVVEGHQYRTLLPHHDGHHCSYLTPSRLDDSTWNPEYRRFSDKGFCTTQTHKLYQGIFIVDPGEGLSVTTFYNLLEIIRVAYRRSTGIEAQSVAQVASWLGNNIRKSLALQAKHGSRYLTLGATLGAEHMVYHAIPIHYAEVDFTLKEVERFPELAQLNEKSCDQGNALPIERFLNKMLLETLGLTWTEFRKEYEVCVSSERFDLILGHNLKLLHGGLMGGAGRLIQPICMVMENPSGFEYEAWLADLWQGWSLMPRE